MPNAYGKIDQRQSAQAVVPEQQQARVEAVGKPAGERRAEQIENAHRGEQRRALHLRHAVVGAHRDQVRADVTVRARAADEEAEEKQPEIARLARHAERAERDLDRIFRRRDRGRRQHRPFRRRPQRQIRRALGQQPRDERQHERRRRRDHEHDRPPAEALRNRREERQEHELAGRGTGGENAHREAAMRGEPAIHDRRRQA